MIANPVKYAGFAAICLIFFTSVIKLLTNHKYRLEESKTKHH